MGPIPFPKPPQKKPEPQEPIGKTNFPAPTAPEIIDPRCAKDAIITNGYRLYEIGDPAEGGMHAINLATGYPIVLTILTIESCWLVPKSADYDALLP